MPFTAWKQTERNRQKETDTETEKIFTYYDFMRFGDSSTVPNILNQ